MSIPFSIIRPVYVVPEGTIPVKHGHIEGAILTLAIIARKLRDDKDFHGAALAEERAAELGEALNAWNEYLATAPPEEDDDYEAAA